MRSRIGEYYHAAVARLNEREHIHEMSESMCRQALESLEVVNDVRQEETQKAMMLENEIQRVSSWWT